MHALAHKLRRDLFHLKTQAAAIALVIGCGVATFVMSVSMLRSLEQARERYYADQRFAHVFAGAKRAPASLARRLAEVPGVAAVETRIVAEVTLDLPGMVEPAVGRLISLPDYGEPALNRLHLRRGRWPEAGRAGEVLANEAFAAAHGLAPGDAFHAILNGRRERLVIAGIALSPEYIYQIRGGELFPDDRRFGVLWMREQPLAAAFNLTKAFNDVALTLLHGANEAAVIERVDAVLAAYGGRGAHGRAEQTSHRYVSDELTQLRAMASVPPAIFLLVAAFVLNVVLNRIIATQREQIATLKAFGYTRREIGWHYLQFALLIVIAGNALGVAAGAWLGRGLAELYGRYFRFPEIPYGIEPWVVLLAAGLSLAAAGAGVAVAIARVVRLSPAEAMRPEAPGEYRPAWFERLGVQHWLGPAGRMVLRQIERQPMRAALSVLGIALGIAVMILGSFGKDMVDYIVDFQFGAIQHHDYTVALVEPASAAVVQAAAHLPGVLQVEAFRAVPVRLTQGRHSRRVAITGLPAERELLRLRDAAGARVALPESGLLLSEKLAELLGVRSGDTVLAEVLEGARPTRSLIVAATLRDFSGLAAYMELGALNRFLREGAVVSGLFLSADSSAEAAMLASLKRTPRVASVGSQAASLRSFQRMMSENMLRMRLFNVVFAGIIAFGVVYNTARITLSERARELATLRVLGLGRGEVSAILVGEVSLLALAAAPLGVVLGHGLGRLALAAMETETQRFPFVITTATAATAVLTVFAATAISCLVVRRRIDRLDLIAVLKSQD